LETAPGVALDSSGGNVLILGIDPGFGNYKAALGSKVNIIQSATARPKDIGLADLGMKSASKGVQIVKFDNHEFAVGPGAWYSGRAIDTMDYSALSSPSRLGLFYAVITPLLAEVSAFGAPELGLIVGLPVPLLKDRVQAGYVMEGLKYLKGEHSYMLDGTTYGFVVTKLKVISQPAGANENWARDDNLNLRSGSAEAEILILDVGMNTFDIAGFIGGRLVNTWVGGADVGVKRLLDIMGANHMGIVETDAKLRQGKIRPKKEHLNNWIPELLAVMEKSLGKIDLSRFTAVIPVGGGTVIGGEAWRAALAAKGAAVNWPDQPIVENVLGLAKFGRAYL